MRRTWSKIDHIQNHRYSSISLSRTKTHLSIIKCPFRGMQFPWEHKIASYKGTHMINWISKLKWSLMAWMIWLYQVISTMELYQVMNPPSSIIQRRWAKLLVIPRKARCVEDICDELDTCYAPWMVLVPWSMGDLVAKWISKWLVHAGKQ
jgi:hypothetical protein